MGKKLYKCDIRDCEKLFSSKFSLKRHNLIHLNSKSHICKHCQKAFSLPQYLEEHEYTHTGAKPFVCSINGCTEQFRQRGKLSIHRKNFHQEPSGNLKVPVAGILGQEEEEKEDQIQNFIPSQKFIPTQNYYNDQEHIENQISDPIHLTQKDHDLNNSDFGRHHQDFTNNQQMQFAMRGQHPSSKLRVPNALIDMLRDVATVTSTNQQQTQPQLMKPSSRMSQMRNVQESPPYDNISEDNYEENLSQNNLNLSYSQQNPQQNYSYSIRRGPNSVPKSQVGGLHSRAIPDHSRQQQMQLQNDSNLIKSQMMQGTSPRTSLLMQSQNQSNKKQLMQKQGLSQASFQQYQGGNNIPSDYQLNQLHMQANPYSNHNLQQGNSMQFLQEQQYIDALTQQQQQQLYYNAQYQFPNQFDENLLHEQPGMQLSGSGSMSQMNKLGLVRHKIKTEYIQSPWEENDQEDNYDDNQELEKAIQNPNTQNLVSQLKRSSSFMKHNQSGNHDSL